MRNGPEKGIGHEIRQMTTRKTIYVKFFPTKPLNFPMKSIIVMHILSKIRPDKYKYANGFDGAKNLPLKRDKVFTLRYHSHCRNDHFSSISGTAHVMPGKVTVACRLRLLTKCVRAAAPGRLHAGIPSCLSATSRSLS